MVDVDRREDLYEGVDFLCSPLVTRAPSMLRLSPPPPPVHRISLSASPSPARRCFHVTHQPDQADE